MKFSKLHGVVSLVALSATAFCGGVEWSRAPMPIKTYPVGAPEKNPMFFEKRVYQGSCGKVYPVPFIDKVTDEAVIKEYDAITLENDYTRVVLLPEFGGRIYIGQDKTNNDYDFFYRNAVIKPALVGLAGPWLSGGVEFNWPQHHRPATFMPVEVSVEDGEDGSVTVWMTDHDPLNRLEGAHGICLRPDSSVVELKVRLYNRTPFTQTFLWWANVAVRVHDKYESFFPPDVSYVADHAVRATTAFPRADGLYYGVDYAKRRGADSLAWYKNIPVPTSYMVCATDYDFFGGYDHAARGGFVHVADRHIAPGKKQWTWGNHPFGYAWERELTDDSGPYIELMAGVYTDNQPDFSYLIPYETKTFSQYWWPYKDLGPVQNANARLAVRLKDGIAGVVAAENLGEVEIVLDGEVRKAVLEIGRPVEFDTAARSIVVRKGTETLISYSINRESAEQPINQPWAEPGSVPRREVATEPPAPADIASADELFITAEHLDQYRHPTRMPEAYLDELLRRDPGDSRAHTLYGKRLIQRGRLAEAERHLVRAVKRQMRRHPNPYTGEALYYLGLARDMQGKLDSAYPCYYKATWNSEFRASGYYRLATIDARRGDWKKAREHATEALSSDSRNVKAQMLSKLDFSALAKRQFDPEMSIDAAYDLVEMGQRALAIDRLKSDKSNTLSLYVLAYIARDKTLLAEAAAHGSADYFFPSRLEDYFALKWCDEASGFKDAKLAYALGNWLYDRKRHEEALACWERATKLAPDFPTAWRNLGVALWNVRHDGKAAMSAYEKAMASDPGDARLVAEYDQLREKCKVSPAERLAFLESKKPLVLSRDDAAIQYVTCLNDLGCAEKALEVLAGRRFHPWEGGEGKVLSQYTRVHLELGRAALAAGDFAKALEHADASFDTPRNLGEAYHLLQAKADVNYLRGMALRGLGRTEESRAAFLAAAEEAGDFQAMAVTEYSGLSYWRGLALKELGRMADAKALFEGMRAFAEKGLSTPFKIDYFATSLPLLLIFEDDLEAVKNARMENIKTLAERGLEEIKGGRPFGKTRRGENAFIYTLKGKGGLELEFSNIGGRVARILVPAPEGGKTDVTIGFDDISGWERTDRYSGAIIGRFANRIAGGTFTLGGVKYDVGRNDAANNASLHGGERGWDEFAWEVEPFERENGDVGAVLSRTSPDGEAGYPGEVVARVTYTITAENVWRVDFEATATKATPVNLTQHVYFNMNGGGTVLDHDLMIEAATYLGTDSSLAPVGGPRPVAGTPFDFRAFRKVGGMIDAGHPMLACNPGYNHNWCIDGEGFRKAAELRGEKLAVEVWTDQPGLQVYTANFMGDGWTMKNARALRRREWIALETQHFPDSPNRPDFPSTILLPGKRYATSTEFRFTSRKTQKGIQP